MTRPTGSGSEGQLRERQRCMKCACVLAVPTIVISFIAFIVGAFAITKSGPEYAFPYCLGGLMIAGTFTCISSFLQYRHYNIYSANRDRVTKERVSKWYRQICLLSPFVCTALLLGLVLSGIVGMVQASREKREVNKGPKSEASASINLSYSVASFVITLVLAFLQMSLYCVCSKIKESYSFEHYVHGNDEFYIPTNSYTPRSPYRHTVNTEYETRVNYSNAGRQNHQSNSQSSNTDRNAPRLVARSPYTTDPSTRNNRHTPTHGEGDNVLYSIPIPELYYGRGRVPTAPPSGVNSTGNDPNSNEMNPRLNIDLNDSPPRYEDLTENDLPTYREVIESGFILAPFIDERADELIEEKFKTAIALEKATRELMNNRLNELIDETELVCGRVQDDAVLLKSDIDQLHGCLNSWRNAKEECYAEEKRKAEEELRLREDEERRKKEEAERKRREEAERRKREEAEAKRRAEEERRRQKEQERLQREEEERRIREIEERNKLQAVMDALKSNVFSALAHQCEEYITLLKECLSDDVLKEISSNATRAVRDIERDLNLDEYIVDKCMQAHEGDTTAQIEALLNEWIETDDVLQHDDVKKYLTRVCT